MTKSSVTASGRTDNRYVSRQMKVYVARNDSVWVGFRHVNNLMSLFWNTKTMPILALKRRKLFVMRGRLKAGRWTYLEDLRSTWGPPSSSTSSMGMTCWSKRENRRSCKDARLELSTFSASPAAFSLRLEGDSVFFRRSRLLVDSVSDADASISLLGIASSGTGSSRFAKASAVYSSILQSSNRGCSSQEAN